MSTAGWRNTSRSLAGSALDHAERVAMADGVEQLAHRRLG